MWDAASTRVAAGRSSLGYSAWWLDALGSRGALRGGCPGASPPPLGLGCPRPPHGPLGQRALLLAWSRLGSFRGQRAASRAVGTESRSVLICAPWISVGRSATPVRSLGASTRRHSTLRSSRTLPGNAHRLRGTAVDGSRPGWVVVAADGALGGREGPTVPTGFLRGPPGHAFRSCGRCSCADSPRYPGCSGG